MSSDSKNEKGIKRSEPQKMQLLKQERKRKGPAERMWAPIKLKLNENYNYFTKNWGLRFLYYFAIFVGMPFVYLFFKLKFRFHVIGKSNVKLIKNCSAVTVSNHVHNMDAFMLTYIFYPNTPYFVALKHNFEAFLVGGLVRVMRGVPLPEDIKNFERFSTQVNDVLQRTKRKIHIYPEGEIAPYSKELRPFKNGAFHFAVKSKAPVFPMVFVFPRKGRINLVVGKPIRIEDVPGAQEVSAPKQVLLLSNYTKGVMQDMLDNYYNQLNTNEKEREE